MREIYCGSSRKILKNKKIIEKELNVKVEVKGKNVVVSGKEIDEYVACDVVEAVDMGFQLSDALMLKDEDFMFKKVNIKDLTKRQNLEEVRARIIGTKGKTIRTMENLSDCEIVLKDNTVGIIGPTENVENALHALESLIQGSKQSNVYSYLERQNRNKRKIDDMDLGLKKDFDDSEED